MSAQNIWNFENGQSIFSPICSSAYGTPEHPLPIDCATANNETAARLVGLDSNDNTVFAFQYSTQRCTTSWNAVPIAFDSLTIE